MEHVRVLINKGIDPILESVVQKIWMKTLSISRCMEPSILHKMNLQFPPKSSSFTTENRKLIEAEDRIFNHWGFYVSSLHRILDMESIVWVLYLALVWMQEAITPLELSFWIETGELPFLKLSTFQEPSETRFKVYLPKIVFRITSPPRPLEIEVGAAKLGEDIGLQLPPLNVPLQTLRWTQTLQLPRCIADQAIALYQCYWQGSEFDRENPEHLYYPQMISLCCILASLKIWYGLDDTERNVDGNRDWLEWAGNVWLQYIQPMHDHLHRDVQKFMKASWKETRNFANRTSDGLLSVYDIQMGYKGMDQQLMHLAKPWASHEQENRVLVSKRKAKGVRFMSDSKVYLPSLYLYPIPMYWFVTHFGSQAAGTEWYYPNDFVSVLSVLAGISNVKPQHLIACLASLETKILTVEIDCMMKESEHSSRSSLLISKPLERKLIFNALKKMGFSESQSQQICLRDEVQISRFGKTTASEPETSEKDFAMNAVERFHRAFVPNDIFETHLTLPRTSNSEDVEIFQRGWTDDPHELLLQARLAKHLGQPIVSLGKRPSTGHNYNFYHSQTWAQDDLLFQSQKRQNE